MKTERDSGKKRKKRRQLFSLFLFSQSTCLGKTNCGAFFFLFSEVLYFRPLFVGGSDAPGILSILSWLSWLSPQPKSQSKKSKLAVLSLKFSLLDEDFILFSLASFFPFTIMLLRGGGVCSCQSGAILLESSSPLQIGHPLPIFFPLHFSSLRRGRRRKGPSSSSSCRPTEY